MNTKNTTAVFPKVLAVIDLGDEQLIVKEHLHRWITLNVKPIDESGPYIVHVTSLPPEKAHELFRALKASGLDADPQLPLL